MRKIREQMRESREQKVENFDLKLMMGEDIELREAGVEETLNTLIVENRFNLAQAEVGDVYDDYRAVLAKQGIVDRASLLKMGPRKFIQTSFSPYGSGKAFAGKVTGNKITNNLIGSDLVMVADILFGKAPVETKEQIHAKYKVVLAQKGVTDRATLLGKGVNWFVKTNFEPYGTGRSFAGKILEVSYMEALNLLELELIGNILFGKETEEQFNEKCRELLAKKGVTDRATLLKKGARWFFGENFEPYGTGRFLAGKILNRVIGNGGTVANLKAIADILFEKETKVQFHEKCRELLAKKGVTDRATLLGKGVSWFIRQDFSPYGHGKAFGGKILNRSLKKPLTLTNLESIGNILFGNETEAQFHEKCRAILAKKGVTDGDSLLKKGVVWFIEQDFNPYGKGEAFGTKILGKVRKKNAKIHLSELKIIAGILFGKETRQQFYEKCRAILAQKGVRYRARLLSKGSLWFKNQDFSPYGKTKAFASKILGKSIEGNVDSHKLELIADILFGKK